MIAMDKIRCLLVDDEPLALDALSTLIQKIPEIEIAGRARDAMEALGLIHSENIDLVFLDIQMPELTGLDMLRTLSNPPKVIFTTAYREYAVEAFDLDVIDYLVKPISLERLIKAINRYHERIPARNAMPPHSSGTLTIYSDKKTHKLHPGDILCVEGLKDYALIHTGKGRLITRKTMKKLEVLLAPYGFLRVHRSWIIPCERVSSWTSYSLHIAEKEIPIGKTYRKDILEYLEKK
jgi:DNA-binding LytR/AlgR family response regulator